jgi:drug/metabolite transporter (DMT)-like permease
MKQPSVSSSLRCRNSGSFPCVVLLLAASAVHNGRAFSVYTTQRRTAFRPSRLCYSSGNDVQERESSAVREEADLIQEFQLRQDLKQADVTDTDNKYTTKSLEPTLIETSSSPSAASAVSPSPSSLQVASAVDDNAAAVVRARWLLLGAAALYGTNFSLVKLLGQANIPVGASSTLRFGMAALVTLPWLLPAELFKNKNEKVKNEGEDDDTSNHLAPLSLSSLFQNYPWQAAWLGFEVGAYNSIGYVAQAVGLETTAASKSAFLCSLAVVVVPMLDWLFRQKPIRQQQLVGTILAIAGVAALELGDVLGDSMQLSSGDLASLVQPLCFGLGFWKMEQCMQQYPDEANRSTAAQLLAVFLGSLVFSTLTEPGALSIEHAMEWMSNPQVLFGLFWTGCITTALTVYMETLALKTLSAAETTLIFSTEPIWGTAFAALVMGEQLGVDSAVGAVLILTGCVFSNLGFDGMKKLLPIFNHQDEGKNNERVSDELPELASNQLSADDSRHEMMSSAVKPSRFGGVSGFLSGLWANLALGTAVLAMDVEDFVDEIMNKLDL